MLIIDGHLDLAMNALQWNRNLLSSVQTIRTREQRMPGKGRALGTVAFPEMRTGRVFLSFATLIARSTGNPVPNIDYDSPTQAYAHAQGHLAYYRALERAGHVRVIEDGPTLDAHVAEWLAWDVETKESETPLLGFVIAMEGADPIADPEQLVEWRDAGLRLLSLSHYGPGRYAGGTGTEKGLGDMGPALLQEMERLGLILDLTHLSDPSFWEALEHYGGLVHASHNNCRALVPHQRQFDDNQINAIIQRDGVIGAACDTWMLEPGWINNVTSNEPVTLSKVVDNIDYVCQLAGNSRHAAIGTDLDGGYGREQSPLDLNTIADLQKIPGLLADRGYGEDDISAIMHGNWVRLLRAAWQQ